MLKNIPKILSPELIKVLMEMGHGDQIVIADANFPAANLARNLIRADGHNIPKLLDAILKLFPLDSYQDNQISLMEVVSGDDFTPSIWDEYKQIINKYEKKYNNIEYIERFAFYEKAKKAYCIIATGESSLYANIILKKGVI